MITEALLEVFFTFVESLLSKLPEMNFDVSLDVVRSAASYFYIASLFIPFDDVAAILSIILMLQAFRIVVSLIKTVWALLPVV